MAQIVLGLGTSHSPQLSTPPDLWRNHGERDKRNPDLRKPDGRVYTYEEVLASARPSLQKELTPDTWQVRYDTCQKGIAQVGATLADVAPDVLVMIGDDQKELFQDNNMPAMLVYWGDTFHNVPRYGRGQNVPPSLQAAAWAYGEKEQDFPIATDLASHIIGSLMEQEFDVAHSGQLPPHEGMGHAFSFIYRRIMNGTTMPTVPIMLNTYYPPISRLPSAAMSSGKHCARP